jgi:hypothetical protein
VTLSQNAKSKGVHPAGKLMLYGDVENSTDLYFLSDWEAATGKKKRPFTSRELESDNEPEPVKKKAKSGDNKKTSQYFDLSQTTSILTNTPGLLVQKKKRNPRLRDQINVSDSIQLSIVNR